MSDFRIAIISVIVGAVLGALLGFFGAFVNFKLQARKEKKGKRLEKLEEVYRLIIESFTIIQYVLFYCEKKTTKFPHDEYVKSFILIISLFALYGYKDFEKESREYTIKFANFNNVLIKIENKLAEKPDKKDLKEYVTELKATSDDLNSISRFIKLKIEAIFQKEFGIKFYNKGWFY